MKDIMIEGIEEHGRIFEKYLEKGMMESIQDKAKELHCKSIDIMDAVCLAVMASLKAHGM